MIQASVQAWGRKSRPLGAAGSAFPYWVNRLALANTTVSWQYAEFIMPLFTIPSVVQNQGSRQEILGTGFPRVFG